MASGEVVEAEKLAELGGDWIGSSGLREEHGETYSMTQGRGRLDAMGWRTARADLWAGEAEDANAVEDVAGYMVGTKGSSWVGIADMALPWGLAFAGMDTIAADVAADNGAAEADAGRDVDRVGTSVAYEEVEGPLATDSASHAVACYYGEELPAAQLRGWCSSWPGKPRGLLP